MGDYLSTPIRTKESEDGETARVTDSITNSLNMDVVECKDGGRQWKMHIFVLRI